MKKQIIIIAILTMLFNWAFAQKNSSVPADNLNVSLMDKFAGTWKWASDNSSFTVIFKMNKIAPNVYDLVGWYRYIKNGQLIIDRLGKIDSVKYATVSGYAVNGNDTLHISFSDLTTDKEKNGFIYFTAIDKIRLHLNSGRGRTLEHIRFTPKQVYPDTFPLDFDIILNRE